MIQSINPFLPLDEYIPDGEPHVFGDRVYIFGSHDREGGTTFCELDYVVYSAHVNDLKAWRCEGTIYSARQDPSSTDTKRYMYAPDVVQGLDGRFYLYYTLNGDRGEGGFSQPISVAVCDTPAGKYEYYGVVKTQTGAPMRYLTHDPAVINDNGRIFLYYGWAIERNKPKTRIEAFLLRKVLQRIFGRSSEEMKRESFDIMGANVVELAPDMVTAISDAKRIVPGQMSAQGTTFDGHSFYEASSIRKIKDTYYFIYSSCLNHELCYATSKYPDRGFTYGGTIISNGDIGLDGRAAKDRVNTTGNNHGSIECVNGKWYVFYHRHTHLSSFSRQACAEEIVIEQDGSIKQVEVTSCGLNGKPLSAQSEYPAIMACWLTNGKMPHIVNGIKKKDVPHITHEGNERFISQIKNGTLIGFKYFDFQGKTKVSVKTRGNGVGKLLVMNHQDSVLIEIPISASETWHESPLIGLHALGKKGLFFQYVGRGSLDMLCFNLK